MADPHQDQAPAKLKQFAEYKSGWHYGEGSEFTPEILRVMWELYYFSSGGGISETNAFPGIDGSVYLTLYLGSHCLELIGETDGTITATHEQGRQVLEEQEGPTKDKALQYIKDFIKKCNVSGSSVSHIGTLKQASGEVLDLQTAVMVEFPSFPQDVFMRDSHHYANILPQNTPSGSLQSFSASIQKRFQNPPIWKLTNPTETPVTLT